MSRGGAGRGHSEGSAGGEAGRSVGKQPTEAAGGQHAVSDPDGAKEGRGGEVRDDTYMYMFMWI